MYNGENPAEMERRHSKFGEQRKKRLMREGHGTEGKV